MRRLASASGIAIACLCQAAVAHAAVTSRDAVFATICTDQEATAFQWKGGKWALVPYYPNIYTVYRLDGASAACADLLKAKTDIAAAFVDITYGCYRILPFAQAVSPPIACVEQWASEAADAALTSVTCAGDVPYDWIVFDPTGNFQFARLGTDLTDATPDAGKDPLIMSVGRCALAKRN